MQSLHYILNKLHKVNQKNLLYISIRIINTLG